MEPGNMMKSKSMTRTERSCSRTTLFFDQIHIVRLPSMNKLKKEFTESESKDFLVSQRMGK
jgi:hypothetical protein